MTVQTAEQQQTIDRLNALPPSQHALKMLFQAKVVVNDSGLHLLQLANLAVENGVDPGRSPMLRQMIDRLWEIAASNPERVYRAMTQNDVGDELTDEFLATTTPQEAQEALVSMLV